MRKSPQDSSEGLIVGGRIVPKCDVRSSLFMQIHKIIGVPLGDGVIAGKANPLLDHQRPSKTVMRSAWTHWQRHRSKCFKSAEKEKRKLGLVFYTLLLTGCTSSSTQPPARPLRHWISNYRLIAQTVTHCRSYHYLPWVFNIFLFYFYMFTVNSDDFKSWESWCGWSYSHNTI